MQEEEDISMQLQKISQISNVGAKFSKFQLYQMNLEKIIQQCMKYVKEGISFRDCTNYLHGLGLVYLKQHQMLKQEIETLQSSMMEIEHPNEDEKRKPRSKSKLPKQKANHPEVIEDVQENSNSSRDLPRNITSGQKFQIENQLNQSDSNKVLKKDDSDSSNSYGFQEKIYQDVLAVQKLSLKEVIEKRKIQIENSKASSESSRNTPNIPLIVVNEVEEIVEEQPQFDYGPEQNDSSSLDEEVVQNSLEIKHAQILQDLEEFGVIIQDQLQNSEQKPKDIKKSRKNQQLPMKDDIIDEVEQPSYRKNLSEFIKYQEKYDQLRQKIDVVQLQPEFWYEKDKLMNLIQGLDANQTMLHTKNKKPLSNSKIQAETTFEPSGNIVQESTHYHEDYDISEFPDQGYENEKEDEKEDEEEDEKENEKEKQKMDNYKIEIYEKLLKDLKSEFSKEKVLNQIIYFNFRVPQTSKAKAFQDLLFMGMMGLCKLYKTQEDGSFTKFEIEL